MKFPYTYNFDGQSIEMSQDAHGVLARILEAHAGGAKVSVYRILSSNIDGEGYRWIVASTVFMGKFHTSTWIIDSEREKVVQFSPGPLLNGDGDTPPVNGGGAPKKKSRASTAEVRIQTGARTLTFLNKGRKRAPIGDGMVMINADIKLADGTIVDGVVEISEEDGGEHFGTGIFAPDSQRFTWQDDDDFLSVLGKTKEQVFPYRYRYRVRPQCHDHHVQDDGWC